MFLLCVAFFVYLNRTTSAAAAALTAHARENQIAAFSEGFHEFGITLYQVNLACLDNGCTLD